MVWSIAYLPVDERGGVLGDSALRVLAGLGHEFSVTAFDVGPDRYRRTREVLPDPEFERIRTTDALLVGAPAVTRPGIPPGVLERGIVFRLRRELDLFVNLRSFAGTGPVGALDVAVVRENTEGAYISEGGTLRAGTPYEVATQGSVTTRFGVERCLRYAYELAGARTGRLALVHKVNVLEYSGRIWRDAFGQLGDEFPDVETCYVDVDTACIRLVRDPRAFDVIVTDSLFGDILSDLVAALADALYRSGSADLNPARTGPSLFEPLHAAAVANGAGSLARLDPRGAYAAIALMLDHVGLAASAHRLSDVIGSLDAEPERSIEAWEELVLAAYQVKESPAG